MEHFLRAYLHVSVLSIMALMSHCDFPLLEHGFYLADGNTFHANCAVQCEPGWHYVASELTTDITTPSICTNPPDYMVYECSISQSSQTWTSGSCIQCDQVYDYHDNLLPSTAYAYDEDCNLKCLGNRTQRPHLPNRCVLCDVQCNHGQYLQGDCQSISDCRPCTSKHVGDHWIFVSAGVVDDPLSCQERCESGMFMDAVRINGQDQYQCLPYSNPSCRSDQLTIPGSYYHDAYCEDCLSAARCEGMQLIQTCNPAAGVQTNCEPCTNELLPGREFYGTACDQRCSHDRVLNQVTNECEQCTYVCPPGYNFTSHRRHCEDCVACTNKPDTGSSYVFGCEWQCNDGFQYNSSSNTCTEIQTSVPVETRSSWISFKCEIHQIWTITGCVNCSDHNSHHPISTNLGITWNWKPTRSSCSWECLPGYYAFAVSSTYHQCLTWQEYLAQVEIAPEIVTNTENAHFSITKRHTVPMLKEWQLLMISLLVIFTAVYSFA